jgi:hypothetical protein
MNPTEIAKIIPEHIERGTVGAICENTGHDYPKPKKVMSEGVAQAIGAFFKALGAGASTAVNDAAGELGIEPSEAILNLIKQDPSWLGAAKFQQNLIKFLRDQDNSINKIADATIRKHLKTFVVNVAKSNKTLRNVIANKLGQDVRDMQAMSKELGKDEEQKPGAKPGEEPAKPADQAQATADTGKAMAAKPATSPDLGSNVSRGGGI